MMNWHIGLSAPGKSRGQGAASSGSLVIGAGVWLLAVVSLLGLLIKHSNSPGSPVTVPPRWPHQSQLPREASRATLVMFAHPRCSCTRASLGELELLVARCSGRLNVHVLFIRPSGTAEDWAKSGLWRTAAAIPGVSVHQDNDGVEARRFHSETSGHTLLYDGDGRLLFQGGITISRGHSGDNPGRSAIVALARNESTSRAETPVFGCPLFEAGCQEGVIECKR